MIPLWWNLGLGNMLKIPVNSKCGDWKIFGSKLLESVFIPNTVFNSNDGFMTILIMNLWNRQFKSKRGFTIGVASDIFEPELAEELECDINPINPARTIPTTPLHSPRKLGSRLILVISKINSVKVSSLQTLFTIKEKLDISHNCFSAKQSPHFQSIADLMPEHLTDLFIRASEHLTFFQCLEVAHVLIEYAAPFSIHEFDLGLFILIKQRLRLTKYTAQNNKLRPRPFHFQGEEEMVIQGMLNAGIIQPSAYDWASPVCFVRKRCRGVGLCTGFLTLNSLCIKDAFPLLRISDCLDTLSGNH